MQWLLKFFIFNIFKKISDNIFKNRKNWRSRNNIRLIGEKRDFELRINDSLSPILKKDFRNINSHTFLRFPNDPSDHKGH